ncbi:MAG: hypothetical protein IE919_19450 [Thioclava sp.]|nr:hypothetical protein [Thioclava sp.]
MVEMFARIRRRLFVLSGPQRRLQISMEDLVAQGFELRPGREIRPAGREPADPRLEGLEARLSRLERRVAGQRRNALIKRENGCLR